MDKSWFDVSIDRSHTGSIKWDMAEGAIPLWVADMDFRCPEEVTEALLARVQNGIYGYTAPGPSWAKAYHDFYLFHYAWDIHPDDLIFALGVVPVLSSSVRALCEAGDEVVIFTPVYNIFFNSIVNNHCIPVEVPLCYEDGRYSLDFPQIKAAFAREKAKLCILCNPQNPTGNIWSKEELTRLIQLAKENNVIILSDEIHGPITKPGKEYVPFLSLPGASDIGFSAIAPTKAFNLAGIHTAATVIPNPEIRKKVERRLNTDEVAEPNAFSCLAAEAAFDKGGPWLQAMREYVYANRDYASRRIRNETNLLPIEGDATYLLWVDGTAAFSSGKEFAAFAKERHGVMVSGGEAYGTGGKGFLRINLACPRAQLEEGLNRLFVALSSFAVNN